MLFSLVKNELIKIFCKKKTWFIIIATLCGLVLMNFLMYMQAEERRKSDLPENRIKQIEHNIAEYKSRIIETKETIEDLDKNSEKEKLEYLKESLKDEENQLKNEKEYLNEVKKEINSPKKHWREKVKEDSDSLNVRKKEILKFNSKSEENLQELDNINRSLEENSYYLDNNVEPIDSYGFSLGINAMYIFFFLGVGIIGALMSVFMSDIVSGECSPPTFKFLLVQPISRSKILVSKIIAINIAALLIILGSEVIVNIIGIGIIDGFDSLKALITVGEGFRKVFRYDTINMELINGSGYFITYFEFILKSFMYQSVFLITLTSFIFMISSLFKSNIMSMSVSVIITVVGGVLPQIELLRSGVLKYSFLSYGDVTHLITGWLGGRLYVENFTPNFAVIVMLITTVVCYTISFLRFKNRDIII
ncbi:ABC transporter permease subunit [Clostridium chrysemydis]|uniref:ABC transporter permease subunit n=1 Tax=Clostridium chrysemydis TaxID=2665504 RepID=UPI0018834126